MNTYAYVGGNPISFIDPKGLLSQEVQALVNRAMKRNNCNTNSAMMSLQVERAKRGWEARSIEGKDLRDAENYLAGWNNVTQLKTPAVLNLLVNTYALAPGWQYLRYNQNALGMNWHSPVSLSALMAGIEGGFDGYRESMGATNNCSCE